MTSSADPTQSTLQEIREVIVLAAGASRRMGDLTADKPKSLLFYKDETILGRLIRQLRNAGIERIIVTVGYEKERVKELLRSLDRGDIVVVENDRYAEDVNIHSMQLALAHATDSLCVFEADTIMEDALVNYVTGTDFIGRSVWFTRGAFTSEQYGGILRSDDFGGVTDIRIVPRYADEFHGYTKLTGIMRIHRHELLPFRQLVAEYAAQTIQQYFLIPWIEHLGELPCVEGNAEHYDFQTFNKPAEYARVSHIDFDRADVMAQPATLVDVAALKHIEQFDEARVQALMAKIQDEGIWTKPLYIERNHHLVLDGQHRLQVALRMGLSRVPAQGFDYAQVHVWTLRKEEPVSIPEVITRANAGRLYPYKTVKHKFPSVVHSCHIPIGELRA